jgi:hypothetical protein
LHIAPSIEFLEWDFLEGEVQNCFIGSLFILRHVTRASILRRAN